MDDMSPRGARRETCVREVLLAMLNEPVPDCTSTPFRQVVGRLIIQAAAGEWQAIKEICDRLDGTPKPQAHITGEPRQVLLNTGIRWQGD